jgi:hypothetical protein
MKPRKIGSNLRNGAWSVHPGKKHWVSSPWLVAPGG